MPGSLTSLTTIADIPGWMLATTRSADSNDSTGKPASCNACSLPMRTATSSSMSSTLIASGIIRFPSRRELYGEFGATAREVRSHERTTELNDDAR